MVVLQRDADVEERSESIEKVVYRNNVLRRGRTKGQRGGQKTAKIGGEVARLKA